MAGRQFSFFIGPKDQIALDEALRQSGEIDFILGDSKNGKPQKLGSSILTGDPEQSFKILVVRSCDLREVVFVGGRVKNYVDQDLSPIVEFSRFPKVVDGRLIRASRLYRIDKYWSDNGHLVSKSPDFIAWAEGLFNLAKKSLTKIEQGYYAGSEALELRKAGVAFEGLDELNSP